MDIASNILVKQAISPKTGQSSDVTDPGSVDTQGFFNGAVVANIGAVDDADGDETYDLEVYESDSSDMSSASLVTTMSIDRSNADNTVEVVRLDQLATPRKRYLETRLKTGGNTPSIDIAVEVLLGEAEHAPVGNTVTDV